jgi:hypothetical protein
MNLGQTHKPVDQYGVNTKGYASAESVQIQTNPEIKITSGNANLSENVTEIFKLMSSNGSSLGTQTINMAILPNAQIAVKWSIVWTVPMTHAFASGISMTLPLLATKMNWSKDSTLADYPPNSPYATSGSSVLRAGALRHVKWISFSDKSKHGVAVISDGAPLIANVNMSANPPVLYADTHEAVDCELSSSWVTDQDVILTPGKTISGGFVLRAF